MIKNNLVTVGAVHTHTHTHTEYLLNKINESTCIFASAVFGCTNHNMLENMKTSFM